jgi:hypothetical protein
MPVSMEVIKTLWRLIAQERAAKDISRSSMGFVEEEERNIFTTREGFERGQTSVFLMPRVIWG